MVSELWWKHSPVVYVARSVVPTVPQIAAVTWLAGAWVRTVEGPGVGHPEHGPRGFADSSDTISFQFRAARLGVLPLRNSYAGVLGPEVARLSALLTAVAGDVARAANLHVATSRTSGRSFSLLS